MLIALSSSSCAGGKLRTGLTYLFDGGIKLENPAGYGKEKSVINYINNRFDIYQKPPLIYRHLQLL